MSNPEPNTPENNQNTTTTPEIPENISKLDRNILSATKALDNPTKSNIANHVVSLGGAAHIQTVYKRLKLKDYLHAEIGTIRDHNRQLLDRTIVPDALKVMHKAIKSKVLDEKAKLPYVKLAVDKSFGDIHHVEQPSVINIKSINNAQFVIGQDIADDTLSPDATG